MLTPLKVSLYKTLQWELERAHSHSDTVSLVSHEDSVKATSSQLPHVAHTSNTSESEGHSDPKAVPSSTELGNNLSMFEQQCCLHVSSITSSHYSQ